MCCIFVNKCEFSGKYDEPIKRAEVVVIIKLKMLFSKNPNKNYLKMVLLLLILLSYTDWKIIKKYKLFCCCWILCR